jgi:hypothetical protein
MLSLAKTPSTGKALNFTDKSGIAFDSESCQWEERRRTGVVEKSLQVDKSTLRHRVCFQCAIVFGRFKQQVGSDGAVRLFSAAPKLCRICAGCTV